MLCVHISKRDNSIKWYLKDTLFLSFLFQQDSQFPIPPSPHTKANPTLTAFHSLFCSRNALGSAPMTSPFSSSSRKAFMHHMQASFAVIHNHCYCIHSAFTSLVTNLLCLCTVHRLGQQFFTFYTQKFFDVHFIPLIGSHIQYVFF